MPQLTPGPTRIRCPARRRRSLRGSCAPRCSVARFLLWQRSRPITSSRLTSRSTARNEPREVQKSLGLCGATGGSCKEKLRLERRGRESRDMKKLVGGEAARALTCACTRDTKGFAEDTWNGRCRWGLAGLCVISIPYSRCAARSVGHVWETSNLGVVGVGARCRSGQCPLRTVPDRVSCVGRALRPWSDAGGGPAAGGETRC